MRKPLKHCLTATGVYIIPRETVVMEWRATVEDFLGELREKGSADNTIVAYRNDLNQLTSYLAVALPSDATWSEITLATIQDYVKQLAEQRYSASTIARKVAAFRAFFHWLAQRGLIAENLALQLRSPKVERHVPRLLSEEEVHRLLEAVSKNGARNAQRDRALLEVIYATGMRVSEAINLRLSDVNLLENTVRCVTGGRQRTVPLTSQAVAALRAYLNGSRRDVAAASGDDYVFVNPSGRRITRQAVWQLTRHYAQIAGIGDELTPHTLRHSRAAHMLSAGEDVRRVQAWLGHANIATTQMYRLRTEVNNKQEDKFTKDADL
jgi:integrase/recombinase XerD